MTPKEFYDRTRAMTVGEAYKLAHEVWDDESIKAVKDPNLLYIYWH